MQALSYRPGGVTEWFNEHEKDVNHIQWPSHSPDLNPTEHAREILVSDGVLHHHRQTIKRGNNFGKTGVHPSSRDL